MLISELESEVCEMLKSYGLEPSRVRIGGIINQWFWENEEGKDIKEVMFDYFNIKVIKDTKLARRMYGEVIKREHDGYLWIQKENK